MKKRTVKITCPFCGSTQEESRSAYSTTCRQCRKHLRIEELLHPPRPAPKGPPRERQETCFQCGTVLEIPSTAKSTMCKRCSAHIDLQDHVIQNAVSKNFRTKGRIIIEESGFLFNTETIASEVILRGRFLGKLIAERSLEIHPTAQIRGSFQTALLVIPVQTRFLWPQPLTLVSADIQGELVASLTASGTIHIGRQGVLFGDVEGGFLEVESGAVFVGRARTGMAGAKPAKTKQPRAEG